MNNLLEKFNMNHISDLFDESYKKALADSDDAPWLKETFIRELNRDCNVLPTNLDIVLKALCEVNKNPDLVLFSKTLYHMLAINKHHSEVFGGLDFPKPPEGENTLAYDFFALFPLLARIRQAYSELKDRGISEDILRNTYSGIEGSITSCYKRIGRLSLSVTYFLWCTLYKNGKLINLERFSFEIKPSYTHHARPFINDMGDIVLLMDKLTLHKSGHALGAVGFTDSDGSFEADFHETDTYYEGYPVSDGTHLAINHRMRLLKGEWTPFFVPGDSAISVHIPGGGKLDPDIVQHSYNAARKFFTKYFPEYKFKAFICYSWLLAPELSNLLPPESNILKFQQDFKLSPEPSKGLDVFSFVYYLIISKLEDVDLDALPEVTSLERILKKFYKDGNSVHEFSGIFPF